MTSHLDPAKTIADKYRFLPNVCMHVHVQTTRLGETFVTLLTIIKFLSNLFLCEHLQVTRNYETLVTLLTSIRLLSSVCLHVALQGTSETCSTLLTRKSFLSKVYRY